MKTTNPIHSLNFSTIQPNSRRSQSLVNLSETFKSFQKTTASRTFKARTQNELSKLNLFIQQQGTLSEFISFSSSYTPETIDKFDDIKTSLWNKVTADIVLSSKTSKEIIDIYNQLPETFIKEKTEISLFAKKKAFEDIINANIFSDKKSHEEVIKFSRKIQNVQSPQSIFEELNILLNNAKTIRENYLKTYLNIQLDKRLNNQPQEHLFDKDNIQGLFVEHIKLNASAIPKIPEVQEMQRFVEKFLEDYLT